MEPRNLPYWFDDSQRCLPAGATQMYVLGQWIPFLRRSVAADRVPPAPTAPTRPSARSSSSSVRLRDRGVRPLFPPQATSRSSLPTPTAGHRKFPWAIQWAAGVALTADRDLTITILAGNLVAATQGLTQPAENFAIPLPPNSPSPSNIPLETPLAIVRTGPNDSPCRSVAPVLVHAGDPTDWPGSRHPTRPRRLLPEIVLVGTPQGGESAVWEFLEWLLDADPFNPRVYSRCRALQPDCRDGHPPAP